MDRYSVQDLRQMIARGEAHDLGAIYSASKGRDWTKYLREIGPLDHIGYAAITVGCAGALLRSESTGELYAIAGRTTALFATV